MTSVDTPSEALALSISEKACVDLEYMQQLTGMDESSLVDGLQGVIFRDPVKNEWQTADEYLSGNVRQKLQEAEQAASAADYGLPSEEELAGFASQYLTDIDGSLFEPEPEVCADGIEKLVTSGDTGVFDTAANKAERTFGQLGISDFQKIAEELKDPQEFGESQQPGAVSQIAESQSAF